nr:zinc finger, CCHC-type [Tanacetum cinerariifolium]
YEKKIKFVEQSTGPAPNPETADLDTIDKYYETVNLEDYDQFVQKYNMHNMGKKIAELHAMLKLHEKGAKEKEKNKLAYASKPKIPPPAKRENLAKDSVYHHYKEGLRRSNKLKHGALSLYIGNGMRAAVEAIGSFDLIILSGLIIILDNYHLTPTVISHPAKAETQDATI